MRRKSEVLSRGLTCAIAFSMILTSSPVYTVLAEGDIEYEEAYEEDAVLSDGSEIIEEVPAPAPIFIVKDFKDFEKQDGHFTNPETLEKYGNLMAKVGTPLRELGLPKNLTLVGYWEADETEALQEMELTEVNWKLDEEKYGEWAVYDESLSAEVYTFVPDLKDYVLDKEYLDAIELAEGVKMLKIDVDVHEEEAVPSEEGEVAALVEGDVTVSLEEGDVDVSEEGDITIPEDVVVLQENEVIGEDGTVEGAVEQPASDTEAALLLGEDIVVSEDALADTQVPAIAEEAGNEDDIFASLDDSILNASTEEVNFQVQEEAYEENGDIPVPLDEEEDPAVEEPTPEPIPVEEPTSEPAPAEEPTSEPTSEPTPVEEPTPAPTPIPEVTGILGLSDGTVKSNDNKTSTIIPGGYENEITLSGIACNMNLSSVTLLLDDQPLMTDLNLTVNPTTINLDGYVLVLTVQQNSHAWDGLVCQNCGAVRECEHVPAGEASCIENDFCKICYQELPDTALGHDWIPPTCKTAKSCKRCGTVVGNKLGHVPGDDATCTQNATCDRCGQEIPGTALGHSWKKASCTAPKTCSVCGATEGKKLGHDFGDWQVVQSSTDTTHGVQRSYCQRKSCDAYQEARLNIVGNPATNAILGLREGDDFAQNTRITFTAYGSGMANNEPIDGDVRYLPSTWSIQGQPGTFMSGYEGAFSISQTGTYTVLVTYQKQRFDGNNWISTETADSKSVTFTIGGSTANGSGNAIHINPQTGDDTPIVPVLIALVLALFGIVGTVLFRRKK